MFSHEPLKGVYNGITPCATNHRTKSGVLWPVKLSKTNSMRKDGNSSGKVNFTPKPTCQVSQVERFNIISDDFRTGKPASTVSNSLFNQGCKTAFALLVTPLARSSPVWG